MRRISEKQARHFLTKYESTVRVRAVHYLGFAKRKTLNAIDLDDLLQVGRIAVIEAISSFVEPYCVSEPVYVKTRINQRMIDAIRGASFLSRNDINFTARYSRGRPLTDKQLSQVNRAKSLYHISLAKSRYDGADSDLTYGDTIADPSAVSPDELVEAKLFASQFEHALGVIPRRQAQAVRERLFGESFLHEVAETIGVTESRVCQLQKRGLKNIARIMHVKHVPREVIADE